MMQLVTCTKSGLALATTVQEMHVGRVVIS